MKIAKLKARAIKNLNKNKEVLIPATFILIAITVLAAVIGTALVHPLFGFLLMILSLSFLLPGYVKMTLTVSKSRKAKFDTLFAEKKLFLKYLGAFALSFLIFAVLWLLETIAFKSLIAVLAHQNEIEFALTLTLSVFGILLIVALLMVIIYLVIAFSQSLYILSEQPKLSVREILSKSFDLMGDYTSDYFLLILSFIGWFILGIFTFGVLYLWLVPYMFITTGNFYQVLKREYKKLHDEEKEAEILLNDNDMVK